MKGTTRFGKKGKLGLRYIGPYEILEIVGNVAYRVALMSDLEGLHPVFHVSMIRKYLLGPSHVIRPQEMQLDESLPYEEVSMSIFGQTSKETLLSTVKVVWQNYSHEEATWEVEKDMQIKYPCLFES